MSTLEKLSPDEVTGVAPQLPGYVPETEIYVLFRGWVQEIEADYSKIELEGPEKEKTTTYTSRKLTEQLGVNTGPDKLLMMVEYSTPEGQRIGFIKEPDKE